MKARNKHTRQECEVFWRMCDMGRECQASDAPIKTDIPCLDYNAVVDDYDFWVNDRWVDGADYIKHWYKYEHK